MTMDPGPENSHPVHHCEQCGYELTGLGGLGACPECGSAFSVTIPFRLEKIRWGLVALRMIFPTAAVAVVFVVQLKFSYGAAFSGFLSTVCWLVWMAMAVLVPMDVALRVAERRWTKPRRQVPTALISLAGLALNILVIATLVWLIDP